MNERILKELVTTRNVLKKKLRSIKTGEIESREQLTDTFKPITEPLKEFLNNSKHADRLVKKEESDMKTEAEDDKSIDLRKSSIKLETSTPRKLFEEDTIVNQSSSASGSDNEDEFYSQTSNTEDSFSNLSPLEVRNELDTNYGPHKDLNNKWKFGNSHIDFDQDKIQVGGQIWALTPEDYNGNPIKGGFYEEELSKANHPDTYLVEKVLKTKGEKVLVKWLGFSNNHNSWISKDEIL
ncbi:hypothetical protein EVAR_90882_1 [Eumeta japonica]|uniref:Chromo domain-containing protein n=1 Tax=Eumeta variegata TaxID=151549 RepID=A0A4C1SYK5_EUMVA|nr:hypothetical protein EVAR_90882_1 [Eumeta japonica]